MPNMLQTVFPQVLPLVQRFSDRQDELRGIPPFTLFRSFLGLFFSFYMTEFLLVNMPASLFQKGSLDDFVDIYLHGVLAPKDVI